jgi:dihydroorotate dehydrogenase
MNELLRPLLFKLDPETAHALTLHALRITQHVPGVLPLLARIFAAPPKPVTAFGLTFRNPVGLAAGYDKDAVAVRGLAALGFSHIEVGTVTPRPQEGNPKPRVFRLAEDEAVINRMGFPGVGAEAVAKNVGRLKRSNVRTFKRANVILGANLGKNKDTPLENAAEDYLTLMRIFAPLADYIAINVSSPNTVGLRRLQGREMLENLLGKIAVERHTSHVTRPILVKLSPDLSDEELDDALEVIMRTGMDGVIATNTTLSRAGLRSPGREESGGLSGRPLRVRSEAALGEVVKRVAGRIPVVSVGGIMSPADAKRRLDMGAALVQVYTGLVYAGPGLVREIVRGL